LQYSSYTVCNYKKKRNLIQNSPAIKKRCGPKKAILKKDVKWWPRNGCDGRLMVKFLIATIQVNLPLNPSETWRRQHKFTWIVIIKKFTISHHHSYFLATTLGFTSFFTIAFLGLHLFLQLGCFGLDIIFWRSKPRNNRANLFSTQNQYKYGSGILKGGTSSKIYIMNSC